MPPRTEILAQFFKIFESRESSKWGIIGVLLGALGILLMLFELAVFSLAWLLVEAIAPLLFWPPARFAQHLFARCRTEGKLLSSLLVALVCCFVILAPALGLAVILSLQRD